MSLRNRVWFHKWVLAFLLMGTVQPLCAAPVPPSAMELRALIHRQLAHNPNYARGDLISQTDVEPIFDELLGNGFVLVNDQEELYDSILPDNDLLVRTFRSTDGRNFMRQVAHQPGAYDRLERLSWMPEGRDVLHQLIADPNGPKLFTQLVSPEGIKAIEQKLGDDPRGRNFAQPTGHVHTEDQLEQRLTAMLRSAKPRDGK